MFQDDVKEMHGDYRMWLPALRSQILRYARIIKGIKALDVGLIEAQSGCSLCDIAEELHDGYSEMNYMKRPYPSTCRFCLYDKLDSLLLDCDDLGDDDAVCGSHEDMDYLLSTEHRVLKFGAGKPSAIQGWLAGTNYITKGHVVKAMKSRIKVLFGIREAIIAGKISKYF